MKQYIFNINKVTDKMVFPDRINQISMNQHANENISHLKIYFKKKECRPQIPASLFEHCVLLSFINMKMKYVYI